MQKITINLSLDEQFMLANLFTGMKYANRLNKKHALYKLANKYTKELDKTLPNDLKRKVIDNLITGVKAFQDFPEHKPAIEKIFKEISNRSEVLRKNKRTKIMWTSLSNALQKVWKLEEEAKRKIEEEKRVSKLN